MFTDPIIDESLHGLGQIRPIHGSSGLCIASKMQQQRNAAEHVTIGVALVMHPSDIALNRITEPVGSDTVNCLWL